MQNPKRLYFLFLFVIIAVLFYLILPEYYIFLSIVLIVILILFIYKDKSNLNLVLLKEYFRKKNISEYFVLFIEVANLHKYSQFYDISVSGKILLNIYEDLCTLYSKKAVFLYGSNQIVIAQTFENKNINNVKLRHDEQFDFSQEVIKYIESKKYFFDNSMQFYTASLVIGTGSVGAIFQETKIEELVKLAQFALLKAKEQGVKLLIANDELKIVKKDLDSFNQEIEKGFKLDEFSPFFIPIIDPKTMEIIGCESLVRWNKDKYRIIEASKFKDIAIERNLFEKIDKRVIEKTLQSISQWSTLNIIPKDFKVSINICKQSLLDLNVNGLIESLKIYNLKSYNIEFDLSFEQAISTQEVEVIKTLKSHGFKIAYDTLSYHNILLDLFAIIDFDTVKLNSNFLSKDILNTQQYKFYKAFIKLFKGMNCKITIKNIENSNNFSFIKSLNIDYVEGFYFTKPLDSKNFELFLNKYKNGIK